MGRNCLICEPDILEINSLIKGENCLKFLVDTNDGFHEQVNEKELIHWGSSFGVGIEMTLDEAITSLEDFGYTVEKLENQEEIGGN